MYGSRYFFSAQFTAVLINNNGSTSQPLDPPITGKLSQFRGFNTPRPLPTNANLSKLSVIDQKSERIISGFIHYYLIKV